MTPALQVKIALLTIASILVCMLPWTSAQGQMRPPRPGFPPGVRPPGSIGGMRPSRGIGGGGISWRCPKCGQTGPGAIPPQTCPGCGIRFVNGVGNGSAGGFRVNSAVAPRDSGVNRPMVHSSAPPVSRPPVVRSPVLDGEAEIVPLVDSSEEPPPPSSNKTGLIAVVVGVIFVGVLVLVLGAFLVIHNFKRNHASATRRSHRDDYDD